MSTIKVDKIQNSSGVEQYTAKAWVNFNGTGTVAIRASGNVSSITDNGAGDYTINLINPMPDANYAPNITIGGTISVNSIKLDAGSTLETNSFRINTINGSNSTDSLYVCASIFG